jgi:hypothetical protein
LFQRVVIFAFLSLAYSQVIVSGASGGCGLFGIQIARALVGPEGVVAGICGAQRHRPRRNPTFSNYLFFHFLFSNPWHPYVLLQARAI